MVFSQRNANSISQNSMASMEGIITELFGERLLHQRNHEETIATETAIGSYEVLGLLFGHFSKPCRKFTRKLARAYKESKTWNKSLEIVFVSSDTVSKS